MKLSIIQVGLDRLDSVVSLFDEYRVFYDCSSDLNGARDFLSDRLTNRDSLILLAIDGNGTAHGFAQLFPSFSSVAMKQVWILNDLFTSARSRRRGVGRQLVEAASQFASDAGVCRIDLTTARDNLAAKNLYESVGYDVDTKFDHYKLRLT